METPLNRRDELLTKIVDTLLAEGAGQLALRPLADRVGTSARLLIYHFGSKEELVAAALAEVRHRIAASLRQRAEAIRPRSLDSLMMMVWDWATELDHQPYFRLLFEVDGLSLYNRLSYTEEVRRANSRVWIALVDDAAKRMPHDGRLFSAHSTLIISALSGLLQEFLSTGDRDRTTSALKELSALVSQSGAAAKSRHGTEH